MPENLQAEREIDPLRRRLLFIQLDTLHHVFIVSGEVDGLVEVAFRHLVVGQPSQGGREGRSRRTRSKKWPKPNHASGCHC